MKKLLFLILTLFACVFSFADDSDFSRSYEEKVLVPFGSSRKKLPEPKQQIVREKSFPFFSKYNFLDGAEISEEEAMKLIGGISENKSVIKKEKFWYWATVVNAAAAGGFSVGCIDADSKKELGAFGIPAAVFFLGAIATNHISAHYEKKSLKNYNDYVEEYNKRITNHAENITE
ncbi:MULTISPECIES: hypothetical protein [unclassified Treponema]|uniref:hypothetical protein n=1 Tax=unclassified Treponema TaxID=2638727 RepID=UPI000E9E86D9|nr:MULTISPECIES: hypothetical protein [unclassified Treponema]HBP10111.1 hypothetical protein [Treponema sp.]